MIFAIWAREQANILHMIGIPWNVLSAIFFPQDYTSQQDPSAQYPYEGLDHAKATWHHSLDLLSLCGASGSESRAKSSSSSHLQSVMSLA